MRIREILNQKIAHMSVHSISPDESAYMAAKLMAEKNIGVLAVLDQSKLVGVVSERDILTKIVSKNMDPHQTGVGKIMSTQLVVANPQESLEDCEEKMRTAHCRHILIVDGQKLIGLLSLRDILDASTLQKTEEITVEENRIWALPT